MPKFKEYTKITNFHNPCDLLNLGAKALGLQLTPAQVSKFSSYLSILQIWNSKINLTSIKEPSRIIRLHFIDSLAVAPFISSKGRILDIGSGAGLPGIPLKIILSQNEVVLVESQRKKVNFLKEVGRALQLKGFYVAEGRIEDISTKDIGLFSNVVVRAFGTLHRTLRYAAPYIEKRGKCIIMHGPMGPQQFQRFANTFKSFDFCKGRLEKYSLPMGEEKRSLLIFSK